MLAAAEALIAEQHGATSAAASLFQQQFQKRCVPVRVYSCLRPHMAGFAGEGGIAGALLLPLPAALAASEPWASQPCMGLLLLLLAGSSSRRLLRRLPYASSRAVWDRTDDFTMAHEVAHLVLRHIEERPRPPLAASLQYWNFIAFCCATVIGGTQAPFATRLALAALRGNVLMRHSDQEAAGAGGSGMATR